MNKRASKMNSRILIIASTLIIIAVVLALLFMTSTDSSTTIYVDPSTARAAVSQDFTINIDATNVENLYGWEFKLGWNPAILDLISSAEGPFLNGGGPTLFTYNQSSINAHVTVDCTLIGQISGASGSGILASVQFHVKEAGSCNLALYDTSLLARMDNSTHTITHTAIGGHFSAQSLS